MVADGGLDLLGEDLLATGVDGHRVPAQQFDAAVGIPAGAVPRDRVSDAVDQREGPRALVGVVEVAQRYQAPLRQPADLVVTRRQDAGHGGIDDDGAGVGREPARTGAARGGDLTHLRPGLRGSPGVEDAQLRQRGQESLLDAGAEQRPAAADGLQPTEIPAPRIGLQRIGQRAGERVTHDQDHRHPLPGRQFPDIDGIEMACDRGHHARTPGEDAAERRPLRGAVHQRCARQRPRAAQFRAGHDLLEAGHLIGAAEQPTAHGVEIDIVLAPQHPLGHPGRAAGVEDVEIIRRQRQVQRLGRGNRPEQVLVPQRTRERRHPGSVVDVDEVHVGCRAQRLGQRRTELRVVHHRRRPGIVQHVGQFLGDVAVVDVERGHPGLVGADHAFQIRVAVGHVEREVALPGLVPGQRGAFGVRAQPPVPQHPGEPVGPVVDLPVGEVAPPGHDAVGVGHGGGHRGENLGQVELHPATLRQSTFRPRAPRYAPGRACAMGYRRIRPASPRR